MYQINLPSSTVTTYLLYCMFERTNRYPCFKIVGEIYLATQMESTLIEVAHHSDDVDILAVS